MKKLFGLGAKGRLKAFEVSGTIICKKLFQTRDDALAYVPEFEKLCSTDTGTARDLKGLDAAGISVTIIEFEVMD